MDIFEDAGPGANAHEFTVSEISGAVKRLIEGEFGHVRVRGEIGRVSRPASGHIYFDLKDDRAVIAAVSWKGQAAKPQNARVPNAKSSHRTASTSTALNAGRVPAGTPDGVADSGMFPV